MPTIHYREGALVPFESMPVPRRWQWLNNPAVIHTLERVLRPSKRGRKGYDKVGMLRWLLYKQLTGVTYRDLGDMAGIHHTSFVKFRQRLIGRRWFEKVFEALSAAIAESGASLRLILDSSFVETYSGHEEIGSEYFGYKKANGYKLHQTIDGHTRLPVLQSVSGGARADAIEGAKLVLRAPPSWKVDGVLADKGYDAEWFELALKGQFPRAKIGIPLRKTNQEKRTGRKESSVNRKLRARGESLRQRTRTKKVCGQYNRA